MTRLQDLPADVTAEAATVTQVENDAAPPAEPGSEATATTGRAGRNLPVAFAVGAALGAVVLVTLFTFKPAFLAFGVAAIVVGLWELERALRVQDMRAPLVPLAVGACCILVLAYTSGREAMTVGMLLTALAVVVWRLAEGARDMLPDIAAGLFALVYVPFLAGFVVLMLATHDGARWVTTFIATVVASDVGGYALGVLLGRHPMAPSVSPKKSWEGFAGSVVACAACAAILFETLLHGLPWWQGVVFGLATVCAATLGDLGESMIKRDLGVKDIGHVLPGHGGLMERLDSILPAAPVAWLLLTAFTPTH